MNDLFILHLSDLHFEPDKRDRNKALLKKITEDMKTIPDGKLVVVITGDVMAKGGVLRGKSKESLKPAKDFF